MNKSIKNNKSKKQNKNKNFVQRVIYKCSLCGARFVKESAIDEALAEGCRCGAGPDDIVDVVQAPVKALEEEED